MARRSKQSSDQPDNAEANDGNVDKIREILFGGQMRDYESRLADLEKKILAEFGKVSRSLDSQIKKTDTHVRRELEKLSEQVKSERKARQDEGRKGSKEFTEFSRQVEGWFAELEEQYESDAKEHRSAVETMGADLSDAIQLSHDQLAADIENESKGLNEDKLSRDDLAHLLTEFAKMLKQRSS